VTDSSSRALKAKHGAECCSDGGKVIYLCDLYCKVVEREKLETIIHEGAHHGPAYLDDIQPDPYGRRSCQAMAKDNPDKAIRNADNFCYYVADVVAADTCQYAKDGECDEPTLCSVGTDTTDCNPDSCRWAHDGVCDEPQYCAVGTDTTDCKSR